MNLYQGKVNTLYTISKFDSTIPFYYKERLYSYGFLENTPIKIIKKPMIFGPLIVNILGTNIMIRKNDAKMIIITPTKNQS